MAKGQVLSLLLAQCALLASAAPHACPKRSSVPTLSSSLPSSTVAPIIASSPAASSTVRAEAAAPAEYTANPSIGGGGGSNVAESAHFRVISASTSSIANQSLQHLEAAHSCFVETLGWRTSGLSFNTGGIGKEVGPWYKLNVYSKAASDMSGAAGVQGTDAEAGLAYLNVVDEYLDVPDVVVHEFGHSMHLSEKNWVDQVNTGAWWEPIANFIADTYISTPTCNAARAAAGLSGEEGESIISLQKVIGDSYQVLVDGTQGTGNYYESWPFIAYLTNNPDSYAGLGNDTLLRMIRKYKLESNETPLHTLERLLSEATGNVTVQHVVGRYWAHMAYVDIGHAKAHEAFTAQRSGLTYGNLDGSNGEYTVKSARAPRYLGANIIPLTATGSSVDVAITSEDTGYTATLVVSNTSGVKYTDVVAGKGSVQVAEGDEVSLVVAKTPELVTYDAFNISDELNQGLQYSVKITGATA
ncbi:hypothetical protein BU25DRAFT_115341 [Macroventuria anomochaeta]|uniref:Uncharacterized protein n=1 Tax=Macroventuria anomochaeta TaxID=301207 RepID=A0ACB6RWB1_9PLEO|nr:uncharacterized protein BU25DRAFT_115341 [Macroventuria anomochaeta]KAF2625542.1 hypothetical protein BU25DRAFT_115341 [Macroventuria anomochaeta]